MPVFISTEETMTRTRIGVLALLAVLSALTTGCALNRSEVKLTGPGAETAAPATGRVVAIRSVKDERVFVDKPSDPSVPSLGEEGASKSSAEIKGRAFGRKRNTYGMALGDVLLEPGNSVEKVVRENLGAALRAEGFQVRDAATAGANALLLDVRIRKFWAWVTPGFWAVTIDAAIETDVTPSGMATAPIAVHATHSSMAVTDGVWVEVVDKALLGYRTQAAAAVRGWR
jgi:hypothetical protein